MNWLLIVVVLILAGNLVWGFYKGFFRVIYSMAAWILILFFITWVTPYVSGLLIEHITIDDRIQEACVKKLHEFVLHPDEQGDKSAAKDGEDGGIPLPKVILDQLVDTDEALDKFLENTGAYDLVAERATALAMKAITYAVSFLLAVIIFHLLAVALDLFSKLPLIGEVNHSLGLLAGAIRGLLLVWLIFAVVAMASPTSWGMVLNALIYESAPLVWLYENNFILHAIMLFL